VRNSAGTQTIMNESCPPTAFKALPSSNAFQAVLRLASMHAVAHFFNGPAHHCRGLYQKVD